jgi:hypothetical protein
MNHRRSCTLLAILLLLASAPALFAQGIITCSSNNGKRNYCRIGRFNDARLVHQRSGSPCVRGQTWGVEGGNIWVDRGCRADFQPMMVRGPVPGPPPSQVIRCSSNNGKIVRCGTNGPIVRAVLDRQISGSACVQGQTWGYDRRGVWVDRGCRADIRVFFR